MLLIVLFSFLFLSDLCVFLVICWLFNACLVPTYCPTPVVGFHWIAYTPPVHYSPANYLRNSLGSMLYTGPLIKWLHIRSNNYFAIPAFHPTFTGPDAYLSHLCLQVQLLRLLQQLTNWLNMQVWPLTTSFLLLTFESPGPTLLDALLFIRLLVRHICEFSGDISEGGFLF